MRLERPLFVSIVCAYFFLLNSAPAARAMTKFLGFAKEYSQGGFDQFYSAVKAGLDTALVIQTLHVSVMFLALAGLWAMKRWALLIFSAILCYQMYEQFINQQVSVMSTGASLLALAGCWFYFFSGPKMTINRPEVHYYGNGEPAAREEGEPRSAIEELLY